MRNIVSSVWSKNLSHVTSRDCHEEQPDALQRGLPVPERAVTKIQVKEQLQPTDGIRNVGPGIKNPVFLAKQGDWRSQRMLGRRLYYGPESGEGRTQCVMKDIWTSR